MTKLAIVIASKGRPAELGLWMDHVRRQSHRPDLMIWSVAGQDDLPDLSTVPESERPIIRLADNGLCAQRNAALSALPADTDIVAFFDDDYVPSAHCLAGLISFFERSPDVVGATGQLLADGIHSPGISLETGLAMVDEHDRVGREPVEGPLGPVMGLYGCNMAFRCTAIEGERFDENLPLYGWQEDIDFARRVARHGTLCRTDAFVGVHLGSKGGRVNGRRLGYSQVANMIYLIRKGTMPAGYGLKRMVCNILANHARAIVAEPWIDRRGRLTGNWMAVVDLLRGRMTPLRVLDL